MAAKKNPRRRVVEEVSEEPQKAPIEAETEETPAEPEKAPENTSKPVSSFGMIEEKEEKPAETPVVEEPIAEEVVETPQVTAPEAETSPTEDATDLGEEEISSEDVKDWLKDIRPDTTKELQKSNGPNFRLFFIVLLVLLLTGLVVGGFVYYNQKVAGVSSQNSTNQEPLAETPTPEAPTPTEAEEIDLTVYSLQVLNGNGKPGEASKAQDLLTKGGFANIKTGNASSTDYTNTEVAMKGDIPEAVLTEIETALSSYKVVKSDDVLDDKAAYDIIITLGSD